MRDYISTHISAVYVTDAAGVATQGDVLDYLGESILDGGGPTPGTVSRLSGDTYPETPQSLPPNLIPQPAGEFGSAVGWNSLAGLTIDTEAGLARWDGSSAATSNMTIPIEQVAITGNQYGFLLSVASRSAGSVFPGAQSPATNTVGAGVQGVGNWSRQLTATGAYTTARMSVAAGSILDIDYLRVYDLTTILQKKWRIVFVYSQSNWVGSGNASDWVENDPPEARAITIPSSANNVYGYSLDGDGIGVPILMCDPVWHLSGNVGGGPAGAFARTFCDGLREDEVLIYVAAGYSGGGRSQPGDVWYHDGDGPDGEAWVNPLKQVDAMVARAPEGSTVAGCLFCQGEADLADITGDQHTQMIRGDFELLRGRYGNFPIVINEIGWSDRERADVANMVASQAKLDSNSGDPLSMPLCRYIPRPEGATFIADNLHYDQATQRARGALAATALLDLNYGVGA
ncbi:sialate O-acetylesterase [Paracoccus sp. DMF-8]|uniref:sialate O-acetylesterase n=1 Tax=Paracoccus sp. DMF-8 TaxID=3019445 RepID=UPI0023E8E45F|nr:sialate O-acetylesterase [Paracoccus sp. DMF-8]MDF3606349.1 sialate O-acetylesterase [Paracoccus sp. DMF-8]